MRVNQAPKPVGTSTNFLTKYQPARGSKYAIFNLSQRLDEPEAKNKCVITDNTNSESLEPQQKTRKQKHHLRTNE